MNDYSVLNIWLRIIWNLWSRILGIVLEEVKEYSLGKNVKIIFILDILKL